MRLNVTRCVDEVSATLACPANALAPDTLTDLGGAACFNDARVQVELAPA